MNPKRWDKIYERVRKRHAKITGMPEDSGIAAFNKLNPENFRNLVLEYGIDETSRFIESMEARRHGVTS